MQFLTAKCYIVKGTKITVRATRSLMTYNHLWQPPETEYNPGIRTRGGQFLLLAKLKILGTSPAQGLN